MTKELEPCPFCGSNASIRTDILMFSGLVKAIVECDGCDVYIVSYGKTKDEAIQKASELWNTRYKRTCKMVPDGYGEDSEGYIGFDCDQCGGGMIFPSDCEPAGFCCHCGAEVVDD